MLCLLDRQSSSFTETCVGYQSMMILKLMSKAATRATGDRVRTYSTLSTRLDWSGCLLDNGSRS